MHDMFSTFALGFIHSLRVW